MSFLIRTAGDLRFIPVFAHDIRKKFYSARFRQISHSVHFAEREDMTVILQRDHTPVLHFVVPADDTTDMKSPYPIVRKLVITQLAERDTQLSRPARIWQVDMCLSFPYGIPAQIDIQFIGNDQVSLVSTQVDIKFRGCPIIMISIESHTDKVSHAIIVAVADKTDHLYRMDIFTIDTDIDVFIIVKQFYPGGRIRYFPFIRNDLDETIGPFSLFHPEIFIQASVHDRLCPGHLRYIVNPFISLIKGDNRILLCLTKSTGKQHEGNKGQSVFHSSIYR